VAGTLAETQAVFSVKIFLGPGCLPTLVVCRHASPHHCRQVLAHSTEVAFSWGSREGRLGELFLIFPREKKTGWRCLSLAAD